MCNHICNTSLKWYTRFFISNTFISNTRLNLTKNQEKAKQHPEAELWLIENYSLSSSTSSSKNNRRYFQKCTKNEEVCLNEVIWLMTIKMRLEMKNRSHRNDINRLRSLHGHKYTKCKMCLCRMMAKCIKKQLSNI